MKKIHNILPMLAALLLTVLQSACWNNGYDPDYAFVINMNAGSVSSLTKASSINDMDDFKAQGNFGVFGTRTLPGSGATALAVYANQRVTWDNSSWTYSPLKYWDRDATYHFGAYAPQVSSTSGDGVYVSYSMDNKTFTLNNIPNWARVNKENENSYDGVDYMVAASNGEARTYLSATKPGVVEFSFSHILAMFEVTVSYPSKNTQAEDGELGVDFYLKEVKFGSSKSGAVVNVPSADGKFNYTYDYSSVGAGSYSETGKGITPIYQVAEGQAGLNIPVSPAASLGYWVCVPFEEQNGVYLTVTYKAGDLDPTTSYLKVGTLTKVEAGKKYTVNLTFDKGKPVQLTDVIVSDWPDPEEDNHPVYNW